MTGEGAVLNNIIFWTVTAYCIASSRAQCFGGAFCIRVEGSCDWRWKSFNLWKRDMEETCYV